VAERRLRSTDGEGGGGGGPKKIVVIITTYIPSELNGRSCMTRSKARVRVRAANRRSRYSTTRRRTRPQTCTRFGVTFTSNEKKGIGEKRFRTLRFIIIAYERQSISVDRERSVVAAAREGGELYERKEIRYVVNRFVYSLSPPRPNKHIFRRCGARAYRKKYMSRLLVYTLYINSNTRAPLRGITTHNIIVVIG